MRLKNCDFLQIGPLNCSQRVHPCYRTALLDPQTADITHNAMQPLRDMTGGNVSDYISASSGATLVFIVFLLPKTWKHTLMCTIGRVTR